MNRFHGAALFFAFGVLQAFSAHAQSLLFRAGDIAGDPASQIAAAPIDDENLVTGIVNGQGLLTLTDWSVTQNGVFTRNATAQANGTTADFSLLNTGSTGVVAVVKAQDGTLKLVDWTVSASGAISRAGSAWAGAIVRLAAVAVGDTRIVTATQDSTGVTKLIVWDIDASGTITRRGSDTTSAGSAIAVAVLSAKRVASVIRNSAGKLEVALFSLDASGDLAPLGSAQGPAVSTVSATGTSLDRVVTASRLANGTTEVDAWTNVSDTPVLSSSGHAGPADEITIASLGGVKVATALRQPNKTLAIITWEVSGNVTRLGKIAAGIAGPLAVVPLGWDRIVTPVQEQDGKLELIDWGDASTGLLRSSWDATSPVGVTCGVPPTAPKGGARYNRAVVGGNSGRTLAPWDDVGRDDEGLSGFEAAQRLGTLRPIAQERPVMIEGGAQYLPDPVSPPLSLVFHPPVDGLDPMVAVGQQYVMVSEDHSIEFVVKGGAAAGTQLPSKAGEATCMTSTSFFAGFTNPLNANSSVNRSNINLYQRFPANTGTGLQCDPTNPALPAPCINEFYDTRITYDPYRGRFIVMSAARSSTSLSETNTQQQNEIARRYVAIAVSRSEDPRDGFDQYMVTESSYRDWPRLATANGIIVSAHWACNDTDADPSFCGAGAFENVPLNGRHQRPMAEIFDIDDMTAQSDTPRNWKIETYQTGSGNLYPVIHHGNTQGWTYLVQPRSNGLALWRFAQGDWGTLPALSSASTIFTGHMSGFVEGITLQNGNLYFAGADQVAPRTPNVAPARYRARGMRIGVTSTASSFSLAACPSPNCLSFTFGERDGSDQPSDLLSYEMPSLAVTGAGDMVVVHGRVPISMAHPIGQESRYRVFYHDNRGMQDGAVLSTGSPVLTDIFCINQTPETTPTTENVYHIYYAGGACKTQKNFQDYSTAFADPDGTSVWMAFAAATSSGYAMVAGMVTPLQSQMPLYVGTKADCNAGVVSDNPNHLNCPTDPIGYSISASSAYPAAEFTILYVGTQPGVNAGVVTTNSNHLGGTTVSIGYASLKPISGGTKLYVGVIPNCNAGVVSTNPMHLNCDTALVGYVPK